MGLLFLAPMMVGGAVVWGTSHLCGPYDYHLSFWRIVAAAALFRAVEIISGALLGPVVGSWELVAELMAYILIVKLVLWLPLRLSALIGSIYFVALWLFYFSIGLLHHFHVLF